jgi:hypothetical protein
VTEPSITSSCVFDRSKKYARHSTADVEVDVQQDGKKRKLQNEDDSWSVPQQYQITKHSSRNDRTTKVIVTKQNRNKLTKVAPYMCLKLSDYLDICQRIQRNGYNWHSEGEFLLKKFDSILTKYIKS